MYEMALALKQDESEVHKAIAEKRLPSPPTLRSIRRLREHIAAIKPTPRTKRQRAKSPESISANKFVETLRRIVPAGSRVVFEMDLDPQQYGTTIVGKFIITNVKRGKDGTLQWATMNAPLPSSVPTEVVKAIRKVVG
jgi:hypothetical protein